jgi:uncharacterized FAD-dependent dehydrogenase
MTIYKKSLDARRKNDIHFLYSVAAEIEGRLSDIANPGIRIFSDSPVLDIDNLRANTKPGKKVVIAGSGPCGLFAAYILAYCGVSVTVLERGADVDRRTTAVEKFWKSGELDADTNIQFGEGGAGTFSDGKLNTRIGDPLQRFVLEVFVRCGAPEEILYQAKPHIGTDYLKICVKNLRKEIECLGGRVLFDSCMTDVDIRNDKVVGVKVNNTQYIECDALVAALGHSSRDTYEMLYRHGVKMEQKPFAAGVRIEHSREFINKMQYGNSADFEHLPTADYRLAYNGEDRSCYSFCMCPGGVVVNASSEPEHLVVNGMSYHHRMADNSNSALVVTVRPEDFGDASPLAGVEFQRKYEALAYKAAGGKGPVQLATDFIKNKVSDGFNGVVPSFTGETEFVELRTCLPDFISDTLKQGLIDFNRKIKGFSEDGAILTGVEMRTSAPLRIVRNADFESVSHKGLFPAGEGAGYAGGIMSAAIDGIKTAIQITQR